MKSAHPKRKPRAKGLSLIIELDLGEHVFGILGDFQKRYMLHPEANQANAAKFMILYALMNYERTMERALQVEQYCKAEGIANQDDYIQSFLKMKFPRGRVPRPKAAR